MPDYTDHTESMKTPRTCPICNSLINHDGVPLECTGECGNFNDFGRPDQELDFSEPIPVGQYSYDIDSDEEEEVGGYWGDH